MFCREVARCCVIYHSRQCRFPFVLNVLGSRLYASNGNRDVDLLERFVCFSKHLIHTVLLQTQWEENVQLCKRKKNWVLFGSQIAVSCRVQFFPSDTSLFVFHSPWIEG